MTAAKLVFKFLFNYPCLTLLTTPRGGSTAAPDKCCPLFSIDSGLWNITQNFEFSYLRSLAFGFCQFLAALGTFSKLCF